MSSGAQAWNGTMCITPNASAWAGVQCMNGRVSLLSFAGRNLKGKSDWNSYVRHTGGRYEYTKSPAVVKFYVAGVLVLGI